MEDHYYVQQETGYSPYPQMPQPPKKKKRSFLKGFVTGAVVAVAVLGVVFVGIPVIFNSTSVATEEVLDDETVDKIETLSAYIQSYYYQDVDVDDLRQGLFQGLFDNLDVYSCYYTAEEYEDLYESTLSGTYCGIGASLQQDETSMAVSIVHVYDGSPAQDAGLKAGDIIVSADEYEATAMEVSELVTHIRGEEGTSVHLVINRDGEEMEFDITRKNLSFPTVTSDMLENNTGYIAISEFTDSTTDQFTEALDNLTAQGMESLIVDLRDNPGGVLTGVCDILDKILPEGLIVYTEDRDGNREEYRSTDDESLSVPLVVLVNENSASASEIFAGAIQDRDAGTLLGTTTYGKGVVQAVRALDDGSAVKLTTDYYYTPGGTCIQGTGVTPDIELEYEFLGGEDDEYSYALDNQIQKALEILNQ